jgi:DNA-binding transcriptional MerR regulator
MASENPAVLTVGEMAARAGVPISTLHYYESRGLIKAERSPGRQRRFRRATLRRIAFIRAAQKLGVGLAEIMEALDRLPGQRTPTKAARSGRPFRPSAGLTLPMRKPDPRPRGGQWPIPGLQPLTPATAAPRPRRRSAGRWSG